eukprot:Gb_34761 [translate_table: standard]
MDRSLHFNIILAVFLFTASNPNPVWATFECEDLSIADCAFAVSSSGERCVLEKYVVKNGEIEHKCQRSKIMAERGEMIESEECVKACGLTKMSVGLSTDALLERDITTKLCSSACTLGCPNIIDLFTKLAAGEGNDLQSLCQSMVQRPRKLIANTYSVSVSTNDYKHANEAPINNHVKRDDDDVVISPISPSLFIEKAE